MRLGELLTGIGTHEGGHGQTIRDSAVSTTCKSCGTRQTLDRARAEEAAGDVEYYCSTGCGQLVAAVRSQGGGTFGMESVNGLEVQVGPKAD